MTITTPTTVRSHPAHPVAIRGVGRTFAPRDRHGRPKAVLADIDLEIAAGEIVADSQNNGRVDRILLALVTLAVLGKITDAVIGVVERRLLRRW